MLIEKYCKNRNEQQGFKVLIQKFCKTNNSHSIVKGGVLGLCEVLSRESWNELA